LLPHGGAFASLQEASLEVAYYLDTYFKLDRRHSALDYHSPHQFERDFQISLSYETVRFYWTTPNITHLS
jgi:putative transposase